MLAHQDPAPHSFGTIHVNVGWAAILTGMSVGHIRRLCRQGKIDGAHRRFHQGHWQIPVTSLDRSLDASMRWYMDNQLAGPTALA